MERRTRATRCATFIVGPMRRVIALWIQPVEEDLRRARPVMDLVDPASAQGDLLASERTAFS